MVTDFPEPTVADDEQVQGFLKSLLRRPVLQQDDVLDQELTWAVANAIKCYTADTVNYARAVTLLYLIRSGFYGPRYGRS